MFVSLISLIVSKCYTVPVNLNNLLTPLTCLIFENNIYFPAKCSVDVPDNLFRTPMHYAALLGKSALLRFFLNCGASVRCKDGHGATPLHYAALSNHAVSNLINNI